MPEQKEEEGKIVMETRIDCEACRYKVYKAIIGYPGVEDIMNIDEKRNMVTLKAPKVDAKKLFDCVKKKSGGKIIKLLHPDPKELKKEEKTEEKKEEKKLVEVTVVLKISLCCAACTKKIEKAAWKIKGASIYNVKVDGDMVTIKGWDLDPNKVCETIKRKSGKHVEVAPPKKSGEKKEKTSENKNASAKKEEKQTSKAITEYYVYPPQYFSDENPNSCSIM